LYHTDTGPSDPSGCAFLSVTLPQFFIAVDRLQRCSLCCVPARQPWSPPARPGEFFRDSRISEIDLLPETFGPTIAARCEPPGLQNPKPCHRKTPDRLEALLKDIRTTQAPHSCHCRLRSCGYSFALLSAHSSAQVPDASEMPAPKDPFWVYFTPTSIPQRLKRQFWAVKMVQNPKFMNDHMIKTACRAPGDVRAATARKLNCGNRKMKDTRLLSAMEASDGAAISVDPRSETAEIGGDASSEQGGLGNLSRA